MNKLSPRIIITSIALVIAFLLGIFTGFVARAPSTITTIIPITHTVTMTTTYTPTTITTAPPSKVTVVDALGRHIEVKLSVRRVVALSDTSMEALLILGVNVGDVIVGVTEWAYGKIKAGHYQSLNISKLKIVGKTGFNPNYEAIISLRPDLVIAYDEQPGAELEEKLAPFNITVLRLSFYRPSRMFEDFAQLAIVFGRGDGLERYVSWAKQILSLLDERLRGVEGYRTYWESVSEWSSAGQGSSYLELMYLAKLNPITANFTTPYPKVSPEWVLAQNPSAIIKQYWWIEPLTSNISQWRAVWDSVKSRLSTTDAARSGRIIIILSMSPMNPLYALYIAKVLYPERFADVDPNKYLCEYLNMVSTPCKGIWGYAGPDKPILGWGE